ncbi:MAG TPA: TIGR04086 family membrane protein [Acidimicrobiales bacterium]|jgi:uncharacterized protein YdaU (DUF1376 family)
MTTTTRETRRDRLALAREAGFGRFSLVAVVAGMLVAYGAFAVIAAIAGSVVEAIDAEANVSDYDWETVSLVGGLVLAAVLFLSYFFGGYVAGRMARRAGVLNGLAVFLLGVIVAAVVGGVAAALTDTQQVQDNLRNVGIPTTSDDWQNWGSTIGGLAALALMLIGALLGAMKGERWHGKLIDRAFDPEYGPEAERRRAAAAEAEAAQADWQRRQERMHATEQTRQHAATAPATTAVPVATTTDDERARLQAEEQLAAERNEAIDLRDRPVQDSGTTAMPGGSTSATGQQPVERRR